MRYLTLGEHVNPITRPVAHGRPTPAVAASKGNRRRQMAVMVAAWAFLGLVVGLHIGWRLSGTASMMASQAIAGVVVLSFLGLLLSPLVRRPVESLAGAFCGMSVGLISESLGIGPAMGTTPDLCLVIGA